MTTTSKTDATDQTENTRSTTVTSGEHINGAHALIVNTLVTEATQTTEVDSEVNVTTRSIPDVTDKTGTPQSITITSGQS